MRRILFLSLIILSIILNAALGQAGEKAEPMTVSAGKEITIEYTLKLEDKTTIDSNVGAEPLKFIQGDHLIIPGLETALEGLKVGDKKNVQVKPEDGYGPVDPNAFQEVEKSRVPPEALVIGTPLDGRDPSGRPIHARVSEIKPSTVVLDMNHPLAGKTLFFEVKILDIQAQAQPPSPSQPKPEPESHGHPK
ncbi:MAG: peptidylprolyl isomerase [Nitrospirae bacterium]|nr:peptidylprolyl isomerase [Nitrospirota bacterium]